MSCVVCDSDVVQLRPAVDALFAPYSVRVSRYTAQQAHRKPASTEQRPTHLLKYLCSNLQGNNKSFLLYRLEQKPLYLRSNGLNIVCQVILSHSVFRGRLKHVGLIRELNRKFPYMQQ